MPSNHHFLVKIIAEPGITWNWSQLRLIDTTDRISVLFFTVDEILSKDPDVEIIGYPNSSPF